MTDKCPVCKGKGYIYEESGYDSYGGWHEHWPCTDCNGTGEVYPQASEAVSTMLDDLVRDDRK